MIYLDNAATTFPKPEEVYVAMDKASRSAVNAGRGAYKAAYEKSRVIEETKQELRKLICADIATPVVFSPSITIALNQVVNGLPFRDGENIYISPFEHNAVARTLERIRSLFDVEVYIIPVKDDMEIDFEKLRYMFSQNKPAYIFCTHISNVTGYILPIKEIFCEGKKYNSINILDAAQSLGLIPVDSRVLDADIIAFAGHKTLYGPFGIGGFFNISGIEIAPFLTGGTGSDSLNLNMPDGSESKYEAASTNIVAIEGLHAALKCLSQEQHLNYEIEMTEYLIEQLSNICGVNLLVPPKGKRVGIVSFTLDRYKSDDVGVILDEDYDIAVRTGYHCAPYIHKYLNDERSLGTVRIGISQFTQKKELDDLVTAVKELCEE